MDFRDAECHIDEGSVRDFYIVSKDRMIFDLIDLFDRNPF